MPPLRTALLGVVALAALAALVVVPGLREPSPAVPRSSRSAPSADPAAAGRLLKQGYALAARRDWTAAQREFERVARLPAARRIRDAAGQTVAERARRQAEVCQRQRTGNGEQRTPNTEQRTSKTQRPTLNAQRSTCGPEALAYVLAARGVETRVEELLKLAGTDETGTTMAGLERAAEAKGLTATGYQVTFEGLRRLGLPVVAFVNRPIADGPLTQAPRFQIADSAGNHYVVITRVSGRYVWVVDPASDEGVRGRRGEGGDQPPMFSSQRSAANSAEFGNERRRGRRVAAGEFGKVWAGQVLEMRRAP